MRRRWEQDGKDVQLASNEILPDFCYQLARAIRLGHEIITASIASFSFALGQCMGGYRNDRYRSQRRVRIP